MQSISKNDKGLFELSKWLFVALCFLLFSCTQQAKNGDNENDKELVNLTFISPNEVQVLLNKPISEVVRMVFQDSKGNMWFGTQNGAFKYDGSALIHLDDVESESGKGVTIKDIKEDEEGRIWLGHTGGISSIEGEMVTNFHESDGLISNDVWCIEVDKSGRIWVGTIEGVCTYNGSEFSEFRLPQGVFDSTLGISSTKMVHDIKEDKKGVLWFSSNAGLFSFSNDTLVNVSAKVGIYSKIVNQVFEDSKGGLWISTKTDLYYLRKGNLTNVSNGKIEIGKGMGGIAEDKFGVLWFVCNQHHLYCYDGKMIKEFHKSEENKGPVIFQIYKDQRERLWFVGYGGAFRLEKGIFVNVSKEGPW